VNVGFKCILNKIVQLLKYFAAWENFAYAMVILGRFYQDLPISRCLGKHFVDQLHLVIVKHGILLAR